MENYKVGDLGALISSADIITEVRKKQGRLSLKGISSKNMFISLSYNAKIIKQLNRDSYYIIDKGFYNPSFSLWGKGGINSRSKTFNME